MAEFEAVHGANFRLAVLVPESFESQFPRALGNIFSVPIRDALNSVICSLFFSEPSDGLREWGSTLY